MKNILSLLLILTVLLSFTACKKENLKENIESSSQSEIIVSKESSKDENEETETMVIENLRFLKKDMKGYEDFIKSPILKKAIEEKAVISFNGEIVSSAYDDPVGYNNGAIKFFREAWSEKEEKNASIKIYTFNIFSNGKKTVSSQKITLKNEKAEVIYYYYKNWDCFSISNSTETFESYEVNPYGYIIFKIENGSISESIQIISNYEVLSNCLNSPSLYDDMRKAKEKYLKPIFYDLTNMEFDENDLNKNYLFFLFEDIYNHVNSHGIRDDFTDSNIPVSVITEYLQKYFEITREDVINLVLKDNKDIEYNRDKGTVLYEGGRGGAPICLRIRNIEEKEGLKFISYERNNYMTGFPEQHNLLTVRDLPDGSFRYISNKKISKINDESKSSFIKEITETLKKSVDTFFLYAGSMECDYDAEPIIIKKAKLFPAVNFSSIQELKDYTQKVFSKKFSEKIFYNEHIYGEIPMTEKSGKLYVYNGGMGWCYRFIYETLMIENITENEAIFTIDSSILDQSIQTNKFRAIKENGKWVLDSFYNFE